MFTVKTPEEVFQILSNGFSLTAGTEYVSLSEACGRVLAEDFAAGEYVPGFDRSTVDGYAVRAQDTFGCSDSIPAVLFRKGSVAMGEKAGFVLDEGTCGTIPTGGALPESADAVVMQEYTEDYGDGSIGVLKPVSPGMNIIYRGDDVSPGKVVLHAGRRLSVSDIGALAALGAAEVPVRKRPVAGILSTGDELVPVQAVPGRGQVRDVNSTMLEVLVRELGAVPRTYGIIPDDPALLDNAFTAALKECDLVLVSGGSSVGAKDAAARTIEAHGEILFHGIAIKPGKPTIFGTAGGKPVFGLPGHPAAAFCITRLFVGFLLRSMTGCRAEEQTVTAHITEAVSANHGRSEVLGVHLDRSSDFCTASPIHSKSGLVSSLAESDGFIIIPRDCEGLPAGTEVTVHFYG